MKPRHPLMFVTITLLACEGQPGGPSETIVRRQAATVELDRDLAANAGPPDLTRLQPVERVPRQRFGVVGPAPLGAGDLDAFVFPGLDEEGRQSLLAGLTFFTTDHVAAEGLGPVNNQKNCLGCHRNADEAAARGLIRTPSHVTRAARATPTNFAVTALDPATGGGRPADDFDAIDGAGRTAAFTIFGDFNPATRAFDGLLAFSGFVQHTRPSLPACLPDPLLPIDQDPNLAGGVDPVTRLSATGFRRQTAERAGPPYVGRGLIEAIFADDIKAGDDPDDRVAAPSSLAPAGRSSAFPECPGDCVRGRHNENTSNQAFTGGEAVVRVGRFGLRAAGPTILQFVVGGVQGELGFTSEFNLVDPASHVNANIAGCRDTVPEPEATAEQVLGLRQLIRLTAPPEFGKPLLGLLASADPAAPRDRWSAEGKVQRGAQLFGVDLVAFANRMIPGRMPAGGDGRDPHARDRTDRSVDCASCHTPVQITGQSPAKTGGGHLSNRWAPIFSDVLLHEMPEVTPERIAMTPRNPVVIFRRGEPTFDLARNMAEDVFPNQGLATGREFRTAPLMGLGRIGPPFLHDGRVFLSVETRDALPAGTVYSDAAVTNGPLVVRTLDDALRAAIELHDLPAPARGGRCPVPPGGRVGDVVYASSDDVCPAYDSETSRRNRGEAREVIRRYRSLSAYDQQALIAFLEQL